jgi:hypothetical protein
MSADAPNILQAKRISIPPEKEVPRPAPASSSRPRLPPALPGSLAREDPQAAGPPFPGIPAEVLPPAVAVIMPGKPAPLNHSDTPHALPRRPAGAGAGPPLSDKAVACIFAALSLSPPLSRSHVASGTVGAVRMPSLPPPYSSKGGISFPYGRACIRPARRGLSRPRPHRHPGSPGRAGAPASACHG